MIRYCPCHQPDGSFVPCPRDWCEPFDEAAGVPDNHPDAEVEPAEGWPSQRKETKP